ncbi:GtrA family protein [Enterovibrio sp. 27052020O]|uniref:GtrA family protein n=1 Tax=Enterovibrio sp. 27052020O TaxID=3241166 RepID=UPI00388EC44E
MYKVTLYVLFAIVAMIVNILSQELSSFSFSESVYELEISIIVGTFSGLIVKYCLDKKYIFNNVPNVDSSSLLTFFLYCLMGVVTTFLFWSTEYLFDVWFETKTMRYVGAVIGLSIGYFSKYQLDKKYVFVNRSR